METGTKRRAEAAVGMRSSRRDFLKRGAVAAAVAGLGTTPRLVHAQAKEVVLAGLWPLTGPASQWGVRNSRGERIVYDLVNDRGGIKSLGGAKIKYVVLDTETKVDVAAIRAESLVAQNAVFIAGTSQSAASLVVSQVCERLGVPFVAPVDIEPTLTARGFKYTFRASVSMEDVARDVVEFLDAAGKETGPKVGKVGIVCEDSVLGASAAKSLAKYSKAKGWDVVESITYNAASTKDFTGMVSRLKRNGADVLIGHNKVQDYVLLIRTCIELDYNPMGVAAAMGGAVSNSFPDALKEQSDHIVVIQPFSHDLKIPGLDDFRARYKAAHQEDADLSSVATASAAALVVRALEKAGSTDRATIRNAMAAMDVGLDGNVFLPNGCKFDENGNNVRSVSVATQYKAGRLYTVAPKVLATTKPVWPKPKWARR